jgi:hypothetical protein
MQSIDLFIFHLDFHMQMAETFNFMAKHPHLIPPGVPAPSSIT